MSTRLATMIPAFAPLNLAMVRSLVALRMPSEPVRVLSEEDLARLQQQLDLHTSAVQQAVEQARQDVEALLERERGMLTTQRFLELLQAWSPQRSSPNMATISVWRKRGILRMVRHGVPEIQSVAAILVARRVAGDAARDWLPSSIAPSEPQWWAWLWETPESVPCPVALPLPQTLSAGALVWTPWRGAAWLPGWEAGLQGAIGPSPATQQPALHETIARWGSAVDPHLQRVLETNQRILGERHDALRASIQRSLADLLSPYFTARLDALTRRSTLSDLPRSHTPPAPQ